MAIPPPMTEFKLPCTTRDLLDLIKENNQIIMKLDARVRRMEQMLGVRSDDPLMMKLVPEKMKSKYQAVPMPRETKISDLPPIQTVRDLTGNRDNQDE